MKQNVTELILKAQSGEDGAFSALKDIYRPLIEASARKFCTDQMSEQDREDFLQEALVHFCNAICSYNCESGGVEFGLYAKICVENGLVSFIRVYNRQNRLRAVSLEERTTDNVFDCDGDVLETIAMRERTAVLVRQINKRLSKFENKIWWMYVAGLSVSAIADAVGVERKSVSNAIYRIRKKLKDALSEQNQLR